MPFIVAGVSGVATGLAFHFSSDTICQNKTGLTFVAAVAGAGGGYVLYHQGFIPKFG